MSRNSTIHGIIDQNYNQLNKSNDIPAIFHEINKSIFPASKPTSDLEVAKQISLWLHEYIKGGPGLSEPSDKVLIIMLAGKGGVCSDMAQIFNNFCVINDIQVREWGVTRAPFDKTYGGHSFNEIFCKEINKWVLFDCYWCVYFCDNKGLPFSVTELYQSVRNNERVITEVYKKVSFLPENGFKINFFHLNNIPFLICNYSNKRYDRLLKYTNKYIPIFVSHFLLFILFKSYHYRFPIDNYKKIFS